MEWWGKGALPLYYMYLFGEKGLRCGSNGKFVSLLHVLFYRAFSLLFFLYKIPISTEVWDAEHKGYLACITLRLRGVCLLWRGLILRAQLFSHGYAPYSSVQT